MVAPRVVRSPSAIAAFTVALFSALISLGAAGCHFENRDDLRPAAGTLQTSDGVEYFAREIIVRVRPGANASAVDAAIAKVGGKVLGEPGAPRRCARVGGGGRAEPGPLADLGYRRIRLDGPTADQAISKLIATPGID